MEYLTSKAHYPGALSDEAVILLKTIIAAGAYQPDYPTMNRTQLDGLGQLIRFGYIQSCSRWQYRARGVDPMAAIKAHQDVRNTEAYIRQAFVTLGVETGNIRAIHHSPNGFSPDPRRYCVVLHRASGLSAKQVNAVAGLSSAVWNANKCWVIVGGGK